MSDTHVTRSARRTAFIAAGLLLLTTAATAVAVPSPATATTMTAPTDPAPTASPTNLPTAPLPLPTDDPAPQPADDPPPADLTTEHRFRYSYQINACAALDRVAVAKALRVRSVRVYTVEKVLPGSCLLVDKLKDPKAQWNVVMQPADSPWVVKDSRDGKVIRVAGFKGVVRKLRSDRDVLNLLATRGKHAVYVEVVVRGAVPLAAACAHASKYLTWLDKTKPAHPVFPKPTPVPY